MLCLILDSSFFFYSRQNGIKLLQLFSFGRMKEVLPPILYFAGTCLKIRTEQRG